MCIDYDGEEGHFSLLLQGKFNRSCELVPICPTIQRDNWNANSMFYSLFIVCIKQVTEARIIQDVDWESRL